jgi:hypothetical protein
MVFKSRGKRWVGHGKRNAYNLLVWKPEGKRQLGRSKTRWKKLTMGLRECVWIKKLRFHNRWEIYWLAEWLLSSQRGLCAMNLFIYLFS